MEFNGGECEHCWIGDDWGGGARKEVSECADGCGDQIVAATDITKSIGSKGGGGLDGGRGGGVRFRNLL